MEVIEQPFRSPQRVSRRSLAWACSLTFAGLVVMSAVSLTGLHQRYSTEANAIAAVLDDTADVRGNPCFIDLRLTFKDFDPTVCLHVDTNRQNYLLIGDSHAAHLVSGLRRNFPGVNIMSATASGCKPLQDGTGAESCVRVRDFVLQTFLPQHPPDLLLISARWTHEDLPSLRATLTRLRETHIPTVVLGPIVEYDQALPRILAASLRRHIGWTVDQHRTPGIDTVDREMAALVSNVEVPYISIYDALCPGEQSCFHTTTRGVPLQFDYGHLTSEGSAFVVTRIAPRLAGAARTREQRQPSL